MHIDDTRCSDVTCEWQLLAQQTVYLTFFTKVGNGLTLFSQISSGCGLDEFEKGDETGNCNETFEEKANVQHENESPNYKYDVPGKQSNEVRWKEIQQLYDVLNKNKTICFNATHGYELKGEDFKTLEQPLLNQTYSVKHTGWLNDKIINAYTHLIVNAARENGIRVLTFDTLFYSRLRHCVVQRADEKKLVRMMFEKKSDYKLETYDYVIIPINDNECSHWTVMIIDIWKTSIHYYNPLKQGMQNETAVKLIKFFFAAVLKWRRKCEVIINKRILVENFKVIWEKSFNYQQDSSSCGVYVLMYCSYLLGLAFFNPSRKDITVIRNKIAGELLIGRKDNTLNEICRQIRRKDRCITAEVYRQYVEGEVLLYCSTLAKGKNSFGDINLKW